MFVYFQYYFKLVLTFQPLPLFFRYGTYYYWELININPELRSLLEAKGISINRSSVPSSRNAIDLTGEQTYNRHAAGSGTGIIGFSRNLSAYFRWQATRHFRAECCEVSEKPVMYLCRIFIYYKPQEN